MVPMQPEIQISDAPRCANPPPFASDRARADVKDIHEFRFHAIPTETESGCKSVCTIAVAPSSCMSTVCVQPVYSGLVIYTIQDSEDTASCART